MAVEHSAHNERMSLEEYLTLVAQDGEHAYEYLDGRIYMMTGVFLSSLSSLRLSCLEFIRKVKSEQLPALEQEA